MVSTIDKVVSGNLENDPASSKTMHKLELYQLPIILKLVCRLFSKEFEIQYAHIRQRISSSFVGLKEGDLCIYRPELALDSRRQTVSSKPAHIVEQLVAYVGTIEKNLLA